MPKETAHFQNFAKLKDTKVEFNDITVLAGKPSTGKSYVMKFMYAIEESNTLLQNNSHGIYSVLKEHDVLDGLLKTNIGVHIQKFVNMKSFHQLIDTYRYNEALEMILGSEIEIRESFGTETQQIVFDSFIDSLRDFALQQDNSKALSDSQKFHYLLRNILQSIFGDITQISNEFQYQDRLIDIDFKENFKSYNLTMADNIKRANNNITVIKDKEELKTLNKGLIIGFGAGDITYQIRGTA